MIKKIVFLLMAALSLTGCNDIYYDAETRLVVEGRLIDINGNPIPGQNIDILVVDKSETGNSESSDVISYGNSDASGAFKFAIPGPRDETNTINIRINKYNSSPNGFQEKQFVNIQRRDFVNYKFDLNTVNLYRTGDIVYLLVLTQQTDPAHMLTNITIEGNRADTVVAVNPETLDYIPDEYQYQVVRNQTVNLKYSVIDYADVNNPVTVDYDIPIEINGQSVDYTLNY